ncbi:MAG: hypothetical protein KI786_04040, partial [Mameliella sp.]|nr:hypothetical protein [Phaeodactylibacter sp.]
MQKHRTIHYFIFFTQLISTFFCRSLALLVMWAALFTVPFLTYAQNWELVRGVDFSNTYFNPDLSGVQGFHAIGFSLGDFGASGTMNDHCAFTNSFSAQDRIAMRVSLQAGVDYRVSLNGKVNRSGQAVDFVYAPAWDIQQTTVVTESIPLANIDYNDPGVTVESNTFSVLVDGNYWVAAEHSGASLPDVFARLDNFIVEELDAASTPNLSLADANSNSIIGIVEVVPGTPFSLCLIPDSAPAEDMEVELSITGESSPHFSGFTTTLLTFPAGSNDGVCFVLSPSPEAVAGTYTFQLTDGNGDEVMSFEVGVEPPCTSIAGSDHIICDGKSVRLGTGCLPEPHPVDGVEYCYAWVPADGLDDPGSAMPMATPTSSTAYFVYVTTSEGEFVGQDDVLVEVTYSSVEITASDLIVCDGQSTTLSLAPNDGDTYRWYLDGVLIAGANSSDVLVDAAGEYTVEVTAADGCIARGTITIGDASDPASQADALKQEGFICIGVTIEEDVVGLRSSTCDTYVDDRTDGIAFSFSGVGETVTDIACTLDQFLAEVEVCGDNLQGLITKESNVCEGGAFFESNATAFESADAGVWLHFIDFPGEEDCLLIRVNSGEDVQTEGYEAYMSSLLGTVANDSDLYGYASKSEQMVDILFNETTLVSFDSIPDNSAQVDNLLPALLPSTDVVLPHLPSGPCNHSDPVVGVSPSGLPVWVPSGARLSFGLPAKFQTLIDNEALIAFTLNEPNGVRGRFVAKGKKCQGEYKFIGYKNQLDPGGVHEFETANLGTSPVKATFGTRNRLGCPNAHISVTFKNYSFELADIDNTAVGNGALVSEFTGVQPYIFQEGEQGPYGIYLCQSDISHASFNDPLSVNLNPHLHPSGMSEGWLFSVKGQGDDEIVYMYGIADPSGDGYNYYRYNCDGSWTLYDDPDRPEMLDFLSALVEVLIDSGHTALDVVGLIPGLGDLADGINFIWYSAEGNYGEAAISAASVGLSFAVAYRLGNKIILTTEGKQVNTIVALFKIASGNGSALKAIDAVKELEKMRAVGMSPTEASRCWNWIYTLSLASSEHKGILLKIAEGGNDDFYKVWRKAARENLADDDITLLFKDITHDVVASFSSGAVSASDDLIDFFVNSNNGVRAWGALSQTAIRTDVAWLNRVSDWLGHGLRSAKEGNLVNLLDVNDRIVGTIR